ncbi:serine/threonine-protein kinase [Ideonella alba]|nr:serine/threonine-protein kinase [Ideonella alba]
MSDLSDLSRHLESTVPQAREGALRMIGKYKVIKKLGEGATSEVFLAWDEFHQREVAIKRTLALAGRSAAEQHFAAHFFAAEAALVGRLNHPNVVQLYDAVEEPDGRAYLVMEYVAGDTLRGHCAPDRLLPLEQVVEIGFKCAMALDYVWRQGVIHRDVKPANILTVEEAGELTDIKLTDFGSALNLTSDRTQVHRVGSLAYMSPEQLDGATLDCRADIYSLGAVLYHLVAGRPPFEAESQGALLNLICHVPPEPLTGCRAGVGEELSQVICGALAKSREDRPANWQLFAQQLSALIVNHQVPRGRLQQVMDSERFNLLRGLEFFTDFGDVQLWEVVRRARWQRFHYGHRIYKRGQQGRQFHIIAQGEVEVFREGQRVARLGAGTSVGEMAYLAPSPELRRHAADVIVSEPCTTISFTPDALAELSTETRHRFDGAFIKVLVRRLHAAHEAMAHPRRIL